MWCVWWSAWMRSIRFWTENSKSLSSYLYQMNGRLSCQTQRLFSFSPQLPVKLSSTLCVEKYVVVVAFHTKRKGDAMCCADDKQNVKSARNIWEKKGSLVEREREWEWIEAKGKSLRTCRKHSLILTIVSFPFDARALDFSLSHSFSLLVLLIHSTRVVCLFTHSIAMRKSCAGKATFSLPASVSSCRNELGLLVH